MEGAGLLITYGGVTKPFVFSENTPISEIEGCLSAVFNCNSFVGLREKSRNIIFPLSFFANNASKMNGLDFELISTSGQRIETKDTFQNATDADNAFQVNDIIWNGLPRKISLIKEFLQILKLDAINLRNLFLTNCRSNYVIEKEEFLAVIVGENEMQNKAVLSLAELLFKVFSRNRSVAKLADVVNGLSILCRGDLHQKVLDSFALQDTNHDGYIRLVALLQVSFIDELLAWMTCNCI